MKGTKMISKFTRAEYIGLSAEKIAADFGVSIEDARRHALAMASDEVFLSDTHQVARKTVDTHLGPMVHLSIKRRDRSPIHDWRELQEIKNELIGAECEAVEIYPAESRLVDSANQYHLWGFADPSFRLPFGFDRRFVTDTPGGNAVQREGAEK